MGWGFCLSGSLPLHNTPLLSFPTVFPQRKRRVMTDIGEVMSCHGTVAQVLAPPPHSKKVMGSIPTWGAVGSGGQVLPRPSVLRWAISRAFLCGVCMFSPCSQGVSSTKNPNRKNMQQSTLLSVPNQDGRFTSLGPRALKSCPLLLGSWRKDSPGWENPEEKFTATSACVCVSCLAT